MSWPTSTNEIMNSYIEWALLNGNAKTYKELMLCEFKPETTTQRNNTMGDILTLESIFDFGKHKDKQVEDVIEDFPRYISWMVENEVREFDTEVMELLAKKGII